MKSPPDGGWGYVVMFASFFVAFISDGVGNSFGVVLPTLVETFQSSVAVTSLPAGLYTGCFLISGPLTAKLAQKFGYRPVAFMGGVVSAVSIALASFSINIQMMIVCYGILTGIGIGLIYLPSITMVNAYFDRKRGMVVGFVTCGSGIGLLTMAPLFEYLIGQFGWRGCYLIISGVFLHLCVCAIVMRPLHDEDLCEDKLTDLRLQNDGGEDALTPLTSNSNYGDKEDGSRCSLSITLPINTSPEIIGKQDNKAHCDSNLIVDGKPLIVSHIGDDCDNQDNIRNSIANSLSTEHDITPVLNGNKNSSLFSNSCQSIINNNYQDLPYAEQNVINMVYNNNQCDSEDGKYKVNNDNYIELLLQGDKINNNKKKDCITIIDNTTYLSHESTKQNGSLLLRDDDLSSKASQQLSLNDSNHHNQKYNTSCIILSEIPDIHTINDNHRLKEHNRHTYITSPNIAPSSNNISPFLKTCLLKNESKHSESDHQLNNTIAEVHSNPTIDDIRKNRSWSETHNKIPNGIIANQDIYSSSKKGQSDDLVMTRSLIGLPTLASKMESMSSLIMLNQPIHATSVSDLSVLPLSSNINVSIDSETASSIICKSPKSETADDESKFIRDESPPKSLPLSHDVAFIIFCLGASLVQLANNLPTTFTPSYALDLGLTSSQSANVISVIGISNTVGRFLAGLLSFIGVGSIRVYNTGILMTGVTCLLIHLCTKHLHMIVFAASFGFFLGAVPPLQSVILVELLGIERLPSSFGVMCFVKSIACMVGPSLAGSLYEISNDYGVTIVFAGIIFLTASFLHILMVLYRRNICK